jgi:hypothetical protein
MVAVPIVIIILFMPTTMTAAVWASLEVPEPTQRYWQNQLQQVSTFKDDTGFTVDLPAGWIANDYANTGLDAQQVENTLGYTKLVTFCTESGAVPSLGAVVPECDLSPFSGEWVTVFRYTDLAKKPEFANIVQSGRALTANDVFLYHLEEMKRWFDADAVNRERSGPPWTNIIYERFTQEDVSIERKAADGTPLPLIIGKAVMNEGGYNLYFIDDTTGYAYRITSDSFLVGEWITGTRPLTEPNEVLWIFNSARLDTAPSSASLGHPLLTYTPPNYLDPNDPGAIVAATPVQQGPSSESSNNNPFLELFQIR